METFIEEVISQYGYVALVLLLAIENIFPPIPSELILTFTGYATTTVLNPFWAVIFATLGSMIGAIILYWIGTKLTLTRLEQLVDSKIGKILHLKMADFIKAEMSFTKYGYWSVFIGRFIPVVRSLISVPAGMTKMNFPRFLLFSTFGSIIWNSVLISLGYYAGKAWQQVLVQFETITTYFKYILILIAGFLIIYFIWTRFIKKSAKE